MPEQAYAFSSRKDNKDGFWQRITSGLGFTGQRYVSALEGDMRNAGSGSVVGRSPQPGLGNYLVRLERSAAGFDGSLLLP